MKQKEKKIAAETSNQTLNSVNNITLDLILNNIEVEMLILTHCILNKSFIDFINISHRIIAVLKENLYVQE